MAIMVNYAELEPELSEIEALTGPVLLEFGAPWCPHCQGAQPHLARALAGHPAVHHVKVEDGKGRPLGRSFRVKLWPTLVFLRDGQEVSRLVRPTNCEQIEHALVTVDPIPPINPASKAS
jgi:thioredoxin 1